MAYVQAMDAITTAQIAEQHGVSVRTIHRMIETTELVPTVKLPGRTGAYLFDPAAVAATFAARKSAQHAA